MIKQNPNSPSAASAATFTVNVVRDAEDPRLWCAAVLGVEDAVVWGNDFEDIEAGIRAKLAELHLGDEPELTWQIDGGVESSTEVPLNPM